MKKLICVLLVAFTTMASLAGHRKSEVEAGYDLPVELPTVDAETLGFYVLDQVVRIYGNVNGRNVKSSSELDVPVGKSADRAAAIIKAVDNYIPDVEYFANERTLCNYHFVGFDQQGRIPIHAYGSYYAEPSASVKEVHQVVFRINGSVHVPVGNGVSWAADEDGRQIRVEEGVLHLTPDSVGKEIRLYDDYGELLIVYGKDGKQLPLHVDQEYFSCRSVAGVYSVDLDRQQMYGNMVDAGEPFATESSSYNVALEVRSDYQDNWSSTGTYVHIALRNERGEWLPAEVVRLKLFGADHEIEILPSPAAESPGWFWIELPSGTTWRGSASIPGRFTTEVVETRPVKGR